MRASSNTSAISYVCVRTVTQPTADPTIYQFIEAAWGTGATIYCMWVQYNGTGVPLLKLGGDDTGTPTSACPTSMAGNRSLLVTSWTPTNAASASVTPSNTPSISVTPSPEATYNPGAFPVFACPRNLAAGTATLSTAFYGSYQVSLAILADLN
jgi:hypothetical protein